jgi:RNA polymerase sigma factor (sigma-70 family)
MPRSSDLRPLTPQERELVESAFKLALFLAGKRKQRWHHIADQIDSCAHESVMKAAIKFRVEKGGNWKNFAAWRVKSGIQTFKKLYMDKVRRRPQYLSVERHWDTYSDSLQSKDKPIGEALEVHDEVEQVLAKMSAQAATCFRGFYLEHKTVEELADELSVNSSTVYDLMLRTARTLRFQESKIRNKGSIAIQQAT